MNQKPPPKIIRQTLAILLALAIATIIAAQRIGESEPSSDPQFSDVQQQLTGLTIAPEDDTGYRREAFGKGWKDLDGDGCTPRNEILARDLKNTTTRDGCRIESGTLHDPYTNTVIDFTKGPETSQEVQIDHLVALNEAWASGAKNWTDDQRLQFANDPLNLLAVDGSANQSKQAQDAGTWLPENPAFHCDYASRQIHIKDTYKLTIDHREYNALAEAVSSC